MGPELIHAADVAAYLQSRADLEPDLYGLSGPIEAFEIRELSGGNLNRVWRVRAEDLDLHSDIESRTSIIVKHAPPYVARRPEIALDPGRLRFEARALALLDSGESINRGDAAASPPIVRTPKLLAFDEQRSVILMEDLGDVGDLGFAIAARDTSRSNSDFQMIGEALGEFIGRLHCLDSGVAEKFQNRAVQETRNLIQYQEAGQYLKQCGVVDADLLGVRAAALGRRFLEPGVCLLMGDLWPASVLLPPGEIGLIDWEFAHCGRPAQDVAHLAAHLWMRSLQPEPAGMRARIAGRAFLEAYIKYSDTEDTQSIAALDEDAGVHFGCEILMRTAGPFQAGYLFEGMSGEEPEFRMAIETAAAAIRDSDWRLADLF